MGAIKSSLFSQSPQLIAKAMLSGLALAPELRPCGPPCRIAPGVAQGSRNLGHTAVQARHNA